MTSDENKVEAKGLGALWARFAKRVKAQPTMMAILAIVAFAFSITPPLAAFGAVLSVTLLFATLYLQRDSVDYKLAPLVKFLAALGLVFGLVVNATYTPGYQNQAVEDSVTAEASDDQSAPADQGELSLLVKVAAEGSANETIKITIEGTASDGTKVNDAVDVKPNSAKELNLGAGDYLFIYDPDKQDAASVLYKHRSHSIEFSATEDKTVTMELVADEAATKAAETAKAEADAKAEAERAAKEQKAAEEAAAKEAAAQQKAAEEAARLQAEQEAAQQAAAQAQQAPVEATVYIAASGNGSRYHSRSSCSNMNGTVALSVSEAQARGYTPCQKCY